MNKNSPVIKQEKLGKFVCRFQSDTKWLAKMFRDCLHHNRGYLTQKPVQGEDGWIIHAEKQILIHELKETLDKARKLADIHSSKLVDWAYVFDKSSEDVSKDNPDQSKNLTDQKV